MIYVFDKDQNLIQMIRESDCLSLHVVEEINAPAQLTMELPYGTDNGTNLQLKLGATYVCVLRPNDTTYLMFRINNTTEETTGTITASESAYDELTYSTWIIDKRPTNVSASGMLNTALLNTSYSLRNCPSTGNLSTSFYYISPYEAIKNVADLFGLEIRFNIVINDNTITAKYLDAYVKQGNSANMKRFEYGSNALEIKREQDFSSIITGIVPRGKGIQLDSDSNTNQNDPAVYGRRLDITGAEWSTSKGDPLDKPKGQEYLYDPVATAKLGLPKGSARYQVVVFEDDDTLDALMADAYTYLQKYSRPQVAFTANIIDVGSLGLGDTVAIIRHDLNIEYAARVYKIDYDMLDLTKSTLELGDQNVSQSSIVSQINSITGTQKTMATNLNTTIWAANHKNEVTYSTYEPSSASLNDVWYKTLPDGSVEMYIYNNGWQLSSPYNDDMVKSINANKITAGTIDAQKVNLINLNANNITTGAISGAVFQTSFNNFGQSVQLDSNGLVFHKLNGNRSLQVKQDGVSVFNPNTNMLIGTLSYAEDPFNGNSPLVSLSTTGSSNLSLGFQSSDTGKTYTPALNIDGATGNVGVHYNLYVNQNLVAGGNLQTGGNLTVTGATNLNNGLIVSGDAGLNAGLIVSGDAGLNAGLIVSGATNLIMA